MTRKKVPPTMNHRPLFLRPARRYKPVSFAIAFSLLAFAFCALQTPAPLSAEATSTPKPSTGAHADDDKPKVKLYELLYDYHFTEPLSTLGQKVRILIWLRYMDFSAGQRRLLLNLGRRFQKRMASVLAEEEKIIQTYEKEIEPVYREIYDALNVQAPDEVRLSELAERLAAENLIYRREDELRNLRIQMVRSAMSEGRDFLHSLSRDQEEKLVTSLFFLRREIDPLANPGLYRSVIGPTWNAGDFSSLLRTKKRKESNLNIGGLWGIDIDPREKSNYVNIRRSVILFFVLKDPALVVALEESLGKRPPSIPQ